MRRVWKIPGICGLYVHDRNVFKSPKPFGTYYNGCGIQRFDDPADAVAYARAFALRRLEERRRELQTALSEVEDVLTWSRGTGADWMDRYEEQAGEENDGA